MDYLFNEIERGLDAGVYQLSLSLTLCIPDICAGLESVDGKTNGEKYKDWYNKYMNGKLFMSADDCYYFRCSFLHQGSTRHEKSKFKKIIFVEPTSSNNIFHNNVLGDALNIDIVIFCNEMISAGRKWYEDVKDSDNYKRNYEKSFKRYPNGLAPYIVGIPIYT